MGLEKQNERTVMKQQMSMEQIQLTAVHALQLPPFGASPANAIVLDFFHQPLASAINHLRELGTAQLIARSGSTVTKDYMPQLDAFIHDVLDTVQLPGEKIGFDIKISDKSGLIVITLFKESA